MADDNTKSIRRIMKGVKEDPTGLGLADDYKGIGTSRGEAFINARGDVTGSGSEGSGDDKDEQPPSSTPDTGTPDDNDTGGGGGTNNGSDPADALSGDVDAVVPVIDTGTQVGTVTGTDPATGNVTSFNPNTIDGIEYISPDGWGAPGEPPGFDPDRTWLYPDTCFASKSTDAIFEAVKADQPGNDFQAYRTSILLGSGGTGACVPSANFFELMEGFRGIDSIWFPVAHLYDDADLATTPTTPFEQPVDGVCAVVFDAAAGGYKGHELDPDCSAAQIVASDSIIIRSVDDPNKYYKFTRLADGGTKITEVDSGGVIITDSVIKTIDEGGRFSNVYPESLDASII